MKLKLWRIYQDVNSDYDTYDSAVVVAEDAVAARSIHPNGPNGWRFGGGGTWAASPDNVGAVCIGEAAPDLEAGTVVLASFNAG